MILSKNTIINIIKRDRDNSLRLGKLTKQNKETKYIFKNRCSPSKGHNVDLIVSKIRFDKYATNLVILRVPNYKHSYFYTCLLIEDKTNMFTLIGKYRYFKLSER